MAFAILYRFHVSYSIRHLCSLGIFNLFSLHPLLLKQHCTELAVIFASWFCIHNWNLTLMPWLPPKHWGYFCHHIVTANPLFICTRVQFKNAWRLVSLFSVNTQEAVYGLCLRHVDSRRCLKFMFGHCSSQNHWMDAAVSNHWLFICHMTCFGFKAYWLVMNRWHNFVWPTFSLMSTPMSCMCF